MLIKALFFYTSIFINTPIVFTTVSLILEKKGSKKKEAAKNKLDGFKIFFHVAALLYLIIFFNFIPYSKQATFLYSGIYFFLHIVAISTWIKKRHKNVETKVEKNTIAKTFDFQLAKNVKNNYLKVFSYLKRKEIISYSDDKIFDFQLAKNVKNNYLKVFSYLKRKEIISYSDDKIIEDLVNNNEVENANEKILWLGSSETYKRKEFTAFINSLIEVSINEQWKSLSELKKKKKIKVNRDLFVSDLVKTLEKYFIIDRTGNLQKDTLTKRFANSNAVTQDVDDNLTKKYECMIKEAITKSP